MVGHAAGPVVLVLGPDLELIQLALDMPRAVYLRRVTVRAHAQPRALGPRAVDHLLVPTPSRIGRGRETLWLTRGEGELAP